MKRGGSHRILHGGHNVAPANHLQGGGGGGDILPAVCGQIGNPNCGGGSRGVVAGGRMGHHNGGRKTATRRSRRGGFRANLAVGHNGGRKTATRRGRRKCRGGYMPEMDWRRPRLPQF